MNKIAIVIPALNEEEAISQLLPEIPREHVVQARWDLLEFRLPLLVNLLPGGHHPSSGTQRHYTPVRHVARNVDGYLYITQCFSAGLIEFLALLC